MLIMVANSDLDGNAFNDFDLSAVLRGARATFLRFRAGVTN